MEGPSDIFKETRIFMRQLRGAGTVSEGPGELACTRARFRYTRSLQKKLGRDQAFDACEYAFQTNYLVCSLAAVDFTMGGSMIATALKITRPYLFNTRFSCVFSMMFASARIVATLLLLLGGL